jgi:hypothetical protein
VQLHAHLIRIAFVLAATIDAAALDEAADDGRVA